MAMTLLEAYRSYNERDIYPFHMPGHKRNTKLMQMDNPYSIDYTEIDDMDDLHEASANPERDTIIAVIVAIVFWAIICTKGYLKARLDK